MRQSINNATRAALHVARTKCQEYRYWQPSFANVPFERDFDGKMLTREHGGDIGYPLPCANCSTYVERAKIPFTMVLDAQLVFERGGKLCQIYHVEVCQNPKNASMTSPDAFHGQLEMFLGVKNMGSGVADRVVEGMRSTAGIFLMVCASVVTAWAFVR